MLFLLALMIGCTASLPIRSESQSAISHLFPRAVLDEFYDYRGLLQSARNVVFFINDKMCLIQQSIVKTQKYALYSGLMNGQKVLIKVFADEQDFLGELSLLNESRSRELLDSKNGKFPILVLKFTDGKALSEIMRNYILGGHLEHNPQDRVLVDRLWPNYEDISHDEFQKICDIYLENKYVVKVGDLIMVHEELDPEKVLITPNLEVKVIDFIKLHKMPKNELDKKLLKANAQETLIDSFNRFKTVLEDETLTEIRKTKIPVEILFNPNFDSAISQIEAVSQMEEIPSYDHSITTIKEENLFDSYDIEFPPLRHDMQDTKNDIRQDLHGFRKNRRKVKSSNNIRKDSSSDSKEYNMDFSKFSSEDLQLDSGHTDVTVRTGSKKSNELQRPHGFGFNDIVAAQSKERFGGIHSKKDGQSHLGFWKTILGPKKNSDKQLADDQYESDDDEGQLIIDGDDNYFINSVEPAIGLQVGSKEYDPSSSALSESFYSTTSDLYNSLTTPSERSTRLRKPRSAGNLSKLVSSEAMNSNNINRAISFISSIRPASPVSSKSNNAIKSGVTRR